MKYTLSKVAKNALIVMAIVTLTSLVGKPIPDLNTLYSVVIAALLAGLLSYERGDQQPAAATDSATTEPPSRVKAFLDF